MNQPTRYRVDQRKYPDRLHWQYPVDVLGIDDHGLWVRVRPGTSALRGTEPRVIRQGFVTLVPPNDPWMAEFNADHAFHVVYVNIGTVPTVADGVIHQVDLDLDVVLTPEGDVRVLDEEEFASARVEHAYPEEIVSHAVHATEVAVERLVNREAPFDGSAARWLERAEASP